MHSRREDVYGHLVLLDGGWQCSVGRDLLSCGQGEPPRRLLPQLHNRWLSSSNSSLFLLFNIGESSTEHRNTAHYLQLRPLSWGSEAEFIWARDMLVSGKFSVTGLNVPYLGTSLCKSVVLAIDSVFGSKSSSKWVNTRLYQWGRLEWSQRYSLCLYKLLVDWSLLVSTTASSQTTKSSVYSVDL